MVSLRTEDHDWAFSCQVYWDSFSSRMTGSSSDHEGGQSSPNRQLSSLETSPTKLLQRHVAFSPISCVDDLRMMIELPPTVGWRLPDLSCLPRVTQCERTPSQRCCLQSWGQNHGRKDTWINLGTWMTQSWSKSAKTAGILAKSRSHDSEKCEGGGRQSGTGKSETSKVVGPLDHFLLRYQWFAPPSQHSQLFLFWIFWCFCKFFLRFVILVMTWEVVSQTFRLFITFRFWRTRRKEASHPFSSILTDNAFQMRWQVFDIISTRQATRDRTRASVLSKVDKGTNFSIRTTLAGKRRQSYGPTSDDFFSTVVILIATVDGYVTSSSISAPVSAIILSMILPLPVTNLDLANINLDGINFRQLGPILDELRNSCFNHQGFQNELSAEKSLDQDFCGNPWILISICKGYNPVTIPATLKSISPMVFKPWISVKLYSCFHLNGSHGYTSYRHVSTPPTIGKVPHEWKREEEPFESKLIPNG